MYIKVISVCLLLVVSLQVSGQAVLFSHFGMDDGTLSDSQGNTSNMLSGPVVGCGVISNGLRFDGSPAIASFGPELNDLFSEDWSMTGYFNIENIGTDPVDLLFWGRRCSVDSIFSLRYLPAAERFRVSLSNVAANKVVVSAIKSNQSCWQYVAIVKEGGTLSVYINGALAGQEAAVSALDLSMDANLSISQSPCQSLPAAPDVPLIGRVDELAFYDGVLTPQQIAEANLRADQITTPDTTIFLGTSLMIEAGPTCAQRFEWGPSTDLSDPLSLSPLASPSEDITYVLTIEDGSCTARDEIFIRVADPNSLGCRDLALPSAFTPNEDRLNDLYGISNPFLISELTLFEVYNRWGARIFGTNDPNAAWDGTYKGSPAPPASYLYKVEYTCQDSTFTKTGTVNLIR